MTHTPQPVVALLPWGDLIEDFLDPLSVSLQSFCEEMTGGWLWGYVEALRRAGVRSAVVCVSSQVAAPTRFVHAPTGAAVWALPPMRVFTRLRRRICQPYGWTLEEMFGNGRSSRRPADAAIRDLIPYLSTPAGRLARVLRSEGAAAIVCQEYESARFDVCVGIGKRLGVPVFGTFQGGDWQRSRMEGVIRPRTIRASAGLIIGPRTEAERVRERYGVEDGGIARIFNPLDLEVWSRSDRAEARAELGIPAAAEVAVWHGRVDVHRKGLDVLLDAWVRVCRERAGRDLRLLLLGTGPDADALRQRIDAAPGAPVLWIDEYLLDRPAMARHLSAADVYALTSRHEGFPVAPLEAMACGLPVIAADAPGVPDILEGGERSGGVVVPREDAAALAGELGAMLDDPDHRRVLGCRARRRVEEEFSLGAVGAQLYSFLLRGSVPRARGTRG